MIYLEIRISERYFKDVYILTYYLCFLEISYNLHNPLEWNPHSSWQEDKRAMKTKHTWTPAFFLKENYPRKVLTQYKTTWQYYNIETVPFSTWNAANVAKEANIKPDLLRARMASGCHALKHAPLYSTAPKTGNDLQDTVTTHNWTYALCLNEAFMWILSSPSRQYWSRDPYSTSCTNWSTRPSSTSQLTQQAAEPDLSPRSPAPEPSQESRAVHVMLH